MHRFSTPQKTPYGMYSNSNTSSLKRAVTADGPVFNPTPLKKQTGLMLEPYVSKHDSCCPWNDSDDEEDHTPAWRALCDLTSKMEAKRDIDATRLFSVGLSPTSTKSVLFAVFPRATFPEGVRLTLTPATTSPASSQDDGTPELHDGIPELPPSSKNSMPPAAATLSSGK
jgi:hypothetical protein